MKKILVVNTIYKEKGGEDTNIVDEVSFLKNFYEVKYLEFKNEGKLSIIDLISFVFNSNLKSNKLMRDVIDEFKPDIAYVHNTWFRANIGIYKILKKKGIKVFHKIHNFRYFCCNFFLLKNHIKDTEYCNMCNLQKENKIFNKYYQNSYLKSFFGILYGKKIYRLILSGDLNLLVMTNFHKKFLIELGVKPENIDTFSNPISYKNTNEYNQISNYLVYAGRVSQDKGVEELIKAWIKADVSNLSLKIIGDGKMLNELKEKYILPNIKFLGLLSHEETLELIKNSRGVVTATKMYEGQPRLLCEASINGIPSLFPDFGGMGEFFPRNYTFKFEQFNYESLCEKLKLFEKSLELKQESIEIQSFTEQIFGKDYLKETLDKIFTQK
tara:strand:- start:290 stop:1438 length:1149 start_codon:yes stop_codon:yes gene_type:complete